MEDSGLAHGDASRLAESLRTVFATNVTNLTTDNIRNAQQFRNRYKGGNSERHPLRALQTPSALTLYQSSNAHHSGLVTRSVGVG